MTLLERTIEDADRRLVILAPTDADVPPSFNRVVGAPHRHTRLLGEVQRLRGRVYLEDGAVDANQLNDQGRHQTPEDDHSWHMVSLNPAGEVVACAWYRLYPREVDFGDLRVRNCPLLSNATWRDSVSQAIETDLRRARTEGIGYAELGGWAIDKAHRCSSQIVLLACAAYGLSRTLGNAVGVATATVRHSSAKILRRLGGSPLRTGNDALEVPPYFDDEYGCTMELLRFDSRTPNVELRPWIDVMRQKLALVPVILNDAPDVVYAESAVAVPQYAA